MTRQADSGALTCTLWFWPVSRPEKDFHFRCWLYAAKRIECSVLNEDHITEATINMTTEATIKDAINRSISHTEIVRVTFAGGDIAAALSEVNAIAEDYDNATENDGDEDVWGTLENGDEFRIRIAIAK